MLHSLLLISPDLESLTKEIGKILNKLNINKFDKEEIKSDKAISIEDIRNIRNKLLFKPLASPSKALIIYNVDKATAEAQNALLKILEEPPPLTYILLTALNENSILPTILSRVQILKFKSETEINDFVEVDKILPSILEFPVGQKLKLAEDVGKNRNNARLFLNSAINYLRNKLLKYYSSKANNPDNKLKPLKIIELIKKIVMAEAFLDQNINVRLTLEVLFLGFSQKD